MINNFDLLILGVNPKYKGFELLKQAVNLKVSDISLSASEIYKILKPEHPTTVEKNIRICLLGSELKNFNFTSVPKCIDTLAKYAKDKEISADFFNPRIKFEKVSFKQFKKDVLECGFKFDDKELQGYYDAIRLPRRATVGSAGYDFFAPFDLVVEAGKTLKFPTGIKAYMDDGIVLTLFPRSGLGFKYGMQLYNTCGIIDAKF